MEFTNIRIDDTDNKGRGVFARKNIKKLNIFESCPVIVIPRKECRKGTVLDNYVYLWNKNAAVPMGAGLCYNHSYEPNAVYELDFKDNVIHFIALRDIKEGEEITVNYNGDPKSKRKVWFEVKK